MERDKIWSAYNEHVSVQIYAFLKFYLSIFFQILFIYIYLFYAFSLYDEFNLS